LTPTLASGFTLPAGTSTSADSECIKLRGIGDIESIRPVRALLCTWGVTYWEVTYWDVTL
jgi:hypothetical protein